MEISLNENKYQKTMVWCQRKEKADESILRRQCRITCGADVVIGHALPYLITVRDEESDSDSESVESDNESRDRMYMSFIE